MNRRNFIQKSILTGSFLGLGGIGVSSLFAKNSKTVLFKYAPRIELFKGNPTTQLKHIAYQGFTAFEDSEIHNRQVAQQEAIAASIKQYGLTMGTFVGHKIYWTAPNLTSGKQHYRDEFIADIKHSITIAQRIDAKWITIVPGSIDSPLEMSFQTQNVVEILKQASALLEPHGITMVLEPFSLSKHSGLFLKTLSQAYEICKAVDSPSCKILFTISSQKTQEESIISSLDKYWNEIAYFQLENKHNDPITSVTDYKEVLTYIHSRGFKGILGMNTISKNATPQETFLS